MSDDNVIRQNDGAKLVLLILMMWQREIEIAVKDDAVLKAVFEDSVFQESESSMIPYGSDEE